MNNFVAEIKQKTGNIKPCPHLQQNIATVTSVVTSVYTTLHRMRYRRVLNIRCDVTIHTLHQYYVMMLPLQELYTLNNSVSTQQTTLMMIV